MLNHFVQADDRTLTEEVWASSVRKVLDGRIVAGRNVLEIPPG